MSGALTPYYDTIVNPDPGLDPADAIDAIDQGLGYTSWKASPNIVYVTSEQDMIDAGLQKPANAEFPLGYYEVPANKSLQPDGIVTHSLPIVSGGGSTGASIIATNPLIDQLVFVGPSGAGPVSREDAGIVAQPGNNLVIQGMIFLSATPGITCVLVDGAALEYDKCIFGYQKEFAFYGNFDVVGGGNNLIAGQTIPSTVTLLGGEEGILEIVNLRNEGSGIFASQNDLFDLTGADAGTLRVTVDGCQFEMTQVGWDAFVVTDDNTIDQGRFTNNLLVDGSLGKFIEGIDETSLNTEFSGNNFPNTNVNASIGVDGNLVATLNPGIADTWVSIVGDTNLGPKVTGWDDNGGADYTLRYIDDNDITPALSTGGNIRRATGSGAIDIFIGVFVNGVEDSTSAITIDGNLQAIPNIPITLPVKNGDVIDFRIKWVSVTNVDAVVEDFGCQIRS